MQRILVVLFLATAAKAQVLLPIANASVTASATISLIDHQSASAAVGGTATTAAMNCAGANFLVAAVANYNSDSSATTVTDSSGNTWTALTNYFSTDSALANLAFWYKANATVSGSQTASVTGSYAAITAACFRVVKTSSPLDQETGSNDVDATMPMSTGSITTTANGDLLMAAVASNNIGSVSIDNSFTVLDTTVFLLPGYGLTMAYKIQSTAAAINPAFTLGTATGNGATAISSFKAQ